MRGGRFGGWMAALALGLAVVLGQPAGPARAADPGPVVRSPILSLDEDRLFVESRYGKAILAARDADRTALVTENRRIEGDLETEERDLTDQRARIGKAQFAPLSEAFNTKVEGIRKAQDAKSKDIDSRFDAQQQRFYKAAGPILAQIMAEHGAVAIISKRAVLVGFDNIDITTEAIGRLDAVLGEGSLVAPAPEAGPDAPAAPDAPPAAADAGDGSVTPPAP